MNRFAIYTACIGGYDDILQPEVVDDRFDFFLFTNDVREERIGVWHVRKVDYSNPDLTRIARHVKTHPEDLLPEYEATLWMDSSLQITSPKVYTRFIELFDQNVVDVASVIHPKRDCIYDEAFEVATRKNPGALEHDYIALKWCRKIWKEQYPQHNGLFETSILYRRKSYFSKQVDELWWECINRYSKRDQLSFNYSLWRVSPEIELFLPLGEHMMNSKNVNYLGHAKVSNRKVLKLGMPEKLRYKYRVRNRVQGMKQWYSLMKSPFPLFRLYTYGTAVALFSMISFKLKKKLHK